MHFVSLHYIILLKIESTSEALTVSDWTYPQKWQRILQLLLIFVVLTGLQFLLTLHLRMGALSVAEPNPEKVEEFNPKLFEVMSFGQLPAVIDWMWIKTLQDPVITHVNRGNHPAIFYTLDLITDLDPVFMEAYTGGATLVSVIRDDGPGALHLLLKGEEFRKNKLKSYSSDFKTRFWSQEWRVPLVLAYVYLFDMDDMPHATGAFKAAQQIDGSPEYLKDLVQKLERPGGQYEVGLRLIDLLIAGATDPEVKERLAHRRESLQVLHFLFNMDERVRHEQKLPATDPWGGILSRTPDGKVTTTTPHKKVFGLE